MLPAAPRRRRSLPRSPGRRLPPPHPPPLPPRGEGEKKCGAGAREIARHLVRIDEDEGRCPLLQQAVDEGGLSGPVRSGEEDEGGHGGRLRPWKADREDLHPEVATGATLSRRERA